MKKRWITCIVFASLGTAFTLAGLIGMKFNFSSFKRGELQNFNVQLNQEAYQNQVKSLKVINYYGELNVSMQDDVDSLSISYTAFKESDISYTVSSNGLLSISKGALFSKPDPWYNPIGYFEKKGTLDIIIPSTWVLNEVSFDIRNGKVHVENLKVEQQRIVLYRGEAQMSDLVGNQLNITTYSGRVSIQNAVFDVSAQVKQSTGKVKIEQLTTKKISFTSLFSELDVSLSGKSEEYDVQIKKSILCSLNINNTENEAEDASYQIEGKMNFSKAKIIFLGNE